MGFWVNFLINEVVFLLLFAFFSISEMKVVAAYLLALLGGNTCPSAKDIKAILASGTFLSFPCVLLVFFWKLFHYRSSFAPMMLPEQVF